MFIETIGFDADDTLWHNESLYSLTQRRFKKLLGEYHSPEWIDRKLYETEMHNLQSFGYGIKGFTLSMIETAIELTEGRIDGRQIQEIIDYAKEMLLAPVELLPGVQDVIKQLAGDYSLILITKGDLFDQETKIARSGLADYFTHVDIVSDKNAQVYADLLGRHGVPSERFLMVGNSLRSDILPVLEIGGRAVFVPYHITWQHEHVEMNSDASSDFWQLETIHQLPEVLVQISSTD